MDPINNQQPQNLTPTPPQPPITPPLAPQPATNVSPMAEQSPQRPEQKTQINDTFARPVAPWPPSEATQEQVSTPQSTEPVSPQTAQTIGLETAQAAGAVPNEVQTTSPLVNNTTQDAPLDQQQEDPLIQAPSASSPLDPAATSMSNEQADSLFKEEESTKKLFKKKKIKKVIKIVLALLLTLIILAGAYIFFIGNSAASTYKNQSSVAAYQEAFAEISDSLSNKPVDVTKLNAGISKLKTAEERNAKLNSVILGDINPNYKKAKNLSSSVSAYRDSTKGYKEKYSYPEFLSALSAANSSVEALQKLNTQTFTTVEDTLSLVKKTSDECSSNASAIKAADKPSDLSLAGEAYYKALTDICTPLESTVQTILKDKTGALSDADKDSLKSALTGVSNSSTSLINGSGASSFFINQLTSYLRAAQDEATKLKDSADSILKA